jgi:trypsin
MTKRFSVVRHSHVILRYCIVAFPAMGLNPTISLAQQTETEMIAPQGSMARSALRPRILWGRDVQAGLGPWAASLQYQHIVGDNNSLRHYCAGSFVSPNISISSDGSKHVVNWESNDNRPEWLVTAAHCIVNDDGSLLDLDRISVLGGARNLANIEGERQQVLKAVVNDGYDPASKNNDIALLMLSPPDKDLPVTDRSSIRFPTIGDTSWIDEDYLAVVAQGWGNTETGFDSLNLKEVILPTVNRDFCARKFSVHGSEVTENMLCAGFVDGNFDSCQGDSGGPLVYRPLAQFATPRSRDAVLVGVISWGIGCGSADLFGIYTRVSVFRTWAEREVLSATGN